MRPYPVIDPRATGENILRRRRELGYSVLDVQKYQDTPTSAAQPGASGSM